MLCPRCRRNKKVTAYAQYVNVDESCRCEPQEDVAHVTGHAYPPITYAYIAPPLSVQAEADRAATPVPTPAPTKYSQYTVYTPLRYINGDFVAHSDQPSAPPASASLGGSGSVTLPFNATHYTVYKPIDASLLNPSGYTTAPSFPAPSVLNPSGYTMSPALPASSGSYTPFDDGGDDEYSSYGAYSVSNITAAPRYGGNVAKMGTAHGGEDTTHNLLGLISLHLRWADAASPPGFQTATKLPFLVKYLRTAGERAPYEVTIANGRATYRGRPMDTAGARKVMRMGPQDLRGPMGEITDRFIYVMSVDGDIYAADASGEYKAGGVFDQGEFKVAIGNTARLAAMFGSTVRPERTGLYGFHHTSFLAGQDVACAGEIEVYKGTIASFNNNSGHYRPPPECLLAVIDRLRQCGVDVEQVKFGINMSNGRVHGILKYFDGATMFIAHLRSQGIRVA